MRALVDSSFLIATARPSERLHAAAAAAFTGQDARRLAVPVTILAETMSFLGARVGCGGQRVFWDRFMRSGVEVLPVDLELMESAREIDVRYPDVGFGFADCTLLAACEQSRCARIYTFDSRLGVYRPSFAPALELMP